MFAGNVSMVFDTLLRRSARQQRQGAPIALMASKRSALLPEVPTFAEAASPRRHCISGSPCNGPGQLPAPVVSALNEALRKAVDSRNCASASRTSARAFVSTPAELTEMTRTRLRRITKTSKTPASGPPSDSRWPILAAPELTHEGP